MGFRSIRFAPLWGVLLVLAASPLSAAVIYDNGPVDGEIDSWRVNGVTRVTNSFEVSGSAILTGAVFGVWGYPGRTGEWVDWAITSTPFGTPLASGRATLTNLFLFRNSVGGDVSQETFDIPALALGPGTYWLELDDTMTTGGWYFWWDQNNGPSQAQYIGEYGSGSISSESFQILGDYTVPEPGTLAMLGCGALLLAGSGLRKRAAGTTNTDR